MLVRHTQKGPPHTGRPFRGNPQSVVLPDERVDHGVRHLDGAGRQPECRSVIAERSALLGVHPHHHPRGAIRAKRD